MSKFLLLFHFLLLLCIGFHNSDSSCYGIVLRLPILQVMIGRLGRLTALGAQRRLSSKVMCRVVAQNSCVCRAHKVSRINTCAEMLMVHRTVLSIRIKMVPRLLDLDNVLAVNHFLFSLTHLIHSLSLSLQGTFQGQLIFLLHL